MGDRPIKKDYLRLLALGIQHRGMDATGFTLVKPDGHYECWKSPMPAWEALATDSWKAWVGKFLTPDVSIAMIHDRSATQGPPKDNENNHPLVGEHVCVMHNGMIHNDGQLFHELKLKRNAAVDSDIFRAILDDQGLTKPAIQTLRKIRGSFAISAVSTRMPGKLLLARSGNPIVIGGTPELMFWASEKSAIHRASRDYILRWGMIMHENKTPCAFVTMPDHTAWLMGENGIEWHEEVKVAVAFNPKAYDAPGEWAGHQGRFEKYPTPVDIVMCPNDGCGRANQIPDELKDTPLKEVNCWKCKRALGN